MKFVLNNKIIVTYARCVVT